jgi:hypothetical protein
MLDARRLPRGYPVPQPWEISMNTVTAAQRLEVSRQDLRRTRLIDDPHAPQLRPLADGEARLRIDAFGLSSNNITYAAMGESMKYWGFFPSGDAQWGCIPVWGFAEVAESRAEGLVVGERCYGYWPMGRYLVAQPVRVSPRGFVDGAAHRAPLPAFYNYIQRCSGDPDYVAAQEPQQVMLRPLFATSFLIDDFLADAQFFGASQVLLSSASSKTAFGTAFCLSLRRGRPGVPRIVGLTSPGNLDFCRSLGCYDEVQAYDTLGAMDRSTPSVYVDFAGNGALRRRIHEHFAGAGDALRYSCWVGATHWDELAAGDDLPGPPPALFFAPAQGAKRSAAPPAGWGAAELQRRIAVAWSAFMERVDDPVAPWLRVRRGQGPQAVRDAITALLDGRIEPREGYMLSL